MQPYKTKITNPWGATLDGRVLVDRVHRQSGSATVTVAEGFQWAKQNLVIPELRTLKAALESGNPLEIRDLTWDGATVRLGRVQVDLDGDKCNTLISRLRELLGAEEERGREEADRRGEVLDGWGPG